MKTRIASWRQNFSDAMSALGDVSRLWKDLGAYRFGSPASQYAQLSAAENMTQTWEDVGAGLRDATDQLQSQEPERAEEYETAWKHIEGLRGGLERQAVHIVRMVDATNRNAD